ncbi:MAG: SDR family NAD(P)-dependent oxidoreductase [Chakrabartia sp.]
MIGPTLIFGASGGIGRALADATAARGDAPVLRFSRAAGDFDLRDEASIARCAARAAELGPPTLVLIATGILSDESHRPERAIREITPEWMAENFATNTIGPALIIKHIAPLLPKSGRSVIAALSARVGSISDNRVGGWHSYRASKAALNMVMKGAAIELARTRPEAICVTLHPGTVATGLSAPYRTSEDAGVLPPKVAAGHLLDVLDRLTPAESGRCFAWDGAEIPA